MSCLRLEEFRKYKFKRIPGIRFSGIFLLHFISVCSTLSFSQFYSPLFFENIISVFAYTCNGDLIQTLNKPRGGSRYIL